MSLRRGFELSDFQSGFEKNVLMTFHLLGGGACVRFLLVVHKVFVTDQPPSGWTSSVIEGLFALTDAQETACQ